jgi:predicted acylesterase/phospholipase RssA
MYKYLVFSSGGVNGISYIGCLKALHERNILSNINGFVGSSIGAFISLVNVIGYTWIELYDLVTQFDVQLLQHINGDTVCSFFNQYGIDDCEQVMKFIRILLSKKGIPIDINFKDLYIKTNKHLMIIGTCLNTRSDEVFDYILTPDMKVLDSIRISVSVPLLYNIYELNDKQYVDGAVSNSYPIDKSPELKHTLGFSVTHTYNCNDKIITFEDYLACLMQCQFKKVSKYEKVKYADHTVYLSVRHNPINFCIDLSFKNKIIDMGYLNTILFLDNKNELSEQKAMKLEDFNILINSK